MALLVQYITLGVEELTIRGQRPLIFTSPTSIVIFGLVGHIEAYGLNITYIANIVGLQPTILLFPAEYASQDQG